MSNEKTEKYVVFNFVDNEIAILKDRPHRVKKILDINKDMPASELRAATVRCDTILEDVMLSIVTYRLKMEQLIGAAGADCISEAIKHTAWRAHKKGDIFTLSLDDGEDASEIVEYCERYIRSKGLDEKNGWEAFAGKSSDYNPAADWVHNKTTDEIHLPWCKIKLRYTDNSLLLECIEVKIDDLQEAIDNGLMVNSDTIKNSVSSMEKKIAEMQAELDRVKNLGK